MQKQSVTLLFEQTTYYIRGIPGTELYLMRRGRTIYNGVPE